MGSPFRPRQRRGMGGCRARRGLSRHAAGRDRIRSRSPCRPGIGFPQALQDAPATPDERVAAAPLRYESVCTSRPATSDRPGSAPSTCSVQNAFCTPTGDEASNGAWATTPMMEYPTSTSRIRPPPERRPSAHDAAPTGSCEPKSSGPSAMFARRQQRRGPALTRTPHPPAVPRPGTASAR